jgi:putative salt-induced outer membrane protein YdiY
MRNLHSRRTLAATLVLALAGLPALAQDAAPPTLESQAIGAPVNVTLKTGEVLRGAFAGVSEGKAIIDHPVLGRVSFPLSELAGWTPVAPVPAGEAPPPVVVPAPAEPAKAPPPPPPPAPDSFFEGWTGGVELGLNGSSGNTERMNVRAGLTAERKTEETETTFGFVYSYATDDGDESENRAQVDLRNDWLLGKDSPWRIYALGRIEYDTFQDWDWRTSAFVGVGYQFIKTEKTSLIGRVGIGASKEFGGDDNRITPELNFGADFEHKFTDTQKMFASLDYYPSLLNFSDYRLVGKAGYEILLDAESGLSLKLGVEDRYDSSPGEDSNRNDIDYFALMVFKF